MSDCRSAALRLNNRRLVPVIAGASQLLCCVIMSCKLLCVGGGGFVFIYVYVYAFYDPIKRNNAIHDGWMFNLKLKEHYQSNLFAIDIQL